jgi:hypothetical protein
MKRLVLFLALIVVNLSLFAKGSGGHSSCGHSSSSSHSSFGGSHSSMGEHSSMSEHSSHSSMSEHTTSSSRPYRSFRSYSPSHIYFHNNFYYYTVYNDNTNVYDTISDNSEQGLKTKLDNLNQEEDYVEGVCIGIIILIILGFFLLLISV